MILWWHVQVASEAAMRAPEEVYKGQQQGAPKAAEELSREERTRLRAKKKRAGKKLKLQQVFALICCTACWVWVFVVVIVISAPQ